MTKIHPVNVVLVSLRPMSRKLCSLSPSLSSLTEYIPVMKWPESSLNTSSVRMSVLEVSVSSSAGNMVAITDPDLSVTDLSVTFANWHGICWLVGVTNAYATNIDLLRNAPIGSTTLGCKEYETLICIGNRTSCIGGIVTAHAVRRIFALANRRISSTITKLFLKDIKCWCTSITASVS